MLNRKISSNFSITKPFLKALLIVVGTFVLYDSLLAADPVKPVTVDILLRGGTIYDGTGNEPIVGDVAIKGDKIIAVGKFPTKTIGYEIDCTRLIIAPGFIDLHNHSDRQIIERLRRANVNYLMQGCTTIVTGNCGSGPVDVADFYKKIENAGAGTNVAHLLPQGSLRAHVMGTAQRPPTPAERNRMRQLVDKAMTDGAWGMSTGLIYVPSTFAQTDELIELAKVVAKQNGIYASHIRNENTELLASVAEALKIGRSAGLPVHISHFKSSGQESWGLVRRAAQMIEQARQAGQTATADQYPYIASSTSLDATLIPTWARAGGRDELIKRFNKPSQMRRIRAEMVINLKKRNGGEALRIARYLPRPDWVGKNLAQISDAEKKDPLDIALEISRNGGASIVNFSMSEEDVRHIMQVPWVATASDGRAYLPNATRPHPRNYGTFPRKLGWYAIREKVLPLEQAIRSASGLPADILGLTDRGYLKPNQFADIAVFDPDQFVDAATFDDPHQYSSGLHYVFVNGQFSVFKGQMTGTLAGKALKHTKQGSEITE